MTLLAKLVRDERGATAIEYGLIAAIAALQGMGNQLKSTFNSASSGMSSGNAA